MKASLNCADRGLLFKVSFQPGPLNAFEVTVFKDRGSGVAPGSAEPGLLLCTDCTVALALIQSSKTSPESND